MRGAACAPSTSSVSNEGPPGEGTRSEPIDGLRVHERPPAIGRRTLVPCRTPIAYSRERRGDPPDSTWCATMSSSSSSTTADNNQNAQLVACVRLFIVISTVVFTIARRALERRMRRRAEQMALLENLYRELSIAAMISFLLFIVNQSGLSTFVADLLGKRPHDLETIVDNAHMLFMSAVVLYMVLCTFIMSTLNVVLHTWNNWDSYQVSALVVNAIALVQARASEDTLAGRVRDLISNGLKRDQAVTCLKYHFQRIVFLEQFASDTSVMQKFQYSKYLRMVLYEVCLELTEARSSVAALAVGAIGLRWLQLAFFDITYLIDFLSLIIWGWSSFFFIVLMHTVLLRISNDFFIDVDRFTPALLKEWQQNEEGRRIACLDASNGRTPTSTSPKPEPKQNMVEFMDSIRKKVRTLDHDVYALPRLTFRVS